MLHADWRGHGQVAIDVQWGKHGSLPHGIVESDLPTFQKLNLFYAFTWIGLPDIWLGDLTRRGPWCFCHGYSRYRDFSMLIPLRDQIDVVVREEDATGALIATLANHTRGSVRGRDGKCTVVLGSHASEVALTAVSEPRYAPR